MGSHTDLIAADLDGINPEDIRGHIRAIMQLTDRQLAGMLGWLQQEQDPTYRIVHLLLNDRSGTDSQRASEYVKSLSLEHQVEFIRQLLGDLGLVRCLTCGAIGQPGGAAAHGDAHQEPGKPVPILFEDVRI